MNDLYIYTLLKKREQIEKQAALLSALTKEGSVASAIINALKSAIGATGGALKSTGGAIGNALKNPGKMLDTAMDGIDIGMAGAAKGGEALVNAAKLLAKAPSALFKGKRKFVTIPAASMLFGPAAFDAINEYKDKLSGNTIPEPDEIAEKIQKLLPSKE